jgi:hypothetical protein
MLTPRSTNPLTTEDVEVGGSARARANASAGFLHKFRATFAARCLWAGVDLRAVTMRYLSPPGA